MNMAPQIQDQIRSAGAPKGLQYDCYGDDYYSYAYSYDFIIMITITKNNNNMNDIIMATVTITTMTTLINNIMNFLLAKLGLFIFCFGWQRGGNLFPS